MGHIPQSVSLSLEIECDTDIPFNSDICKIILAIILPPLGVFLERGCGADLLINILLTILGYIPGSKHFSYDLILVACSPNSPQSSMPCISF